MSARLPTLALSGTVEEILDISEFDQVDPVNWDMSQQHAEAASWTRAIGYDWDENGGVFAVADSQGRVLKSIRVEPTMDGLQQVLELASQFSEDSRLLPVVVEATRRPFLYALRDNGIEVWIANADVLGSYRKQIRSNNRIKSDKEDAALLASRLLQFPRSHRRLLPVNGDHLAITGLIRHEREIVKTLADEANRLRAMLAEANQAPLDAWTTKQLMDSPVPGRYIARVPTLTAGRLLSTDEIEAHLIAAGRQRKIKQGAQKLREAYKRDYVSYEPTVDESFGVVIARQANLVADLVEARRGAVKALDEYLTCNPFYDLLIPAIGAGDQVVARIIGEIGDDPARFTNERGFLAYAAVVPFTAQSGSAQRDRRRPTKGNRLHSAFWDWATSAKLHNPRVRLAYWQHRLNGDYHPTAIRKIAENLAKGVWHCINTGDTWSDDIAWGPDRPGINEEADEVERQARERAKKGTRAVNHGIKGSGRKK
jgi:transposase